ncbi:MAG: hypothetical protein H6840_03510 [Planctomycetes bacterium]|nr:hypothetical protein [Planctomycetota bacterium]
MSFFDFVIYLAVATSALALGIGVCSALSGLRRRVEFAGADEDCRDTALILHGEGRRDCK